MAGNRWIDRRSSAIFAIQLSMEHGAVSRNCKILIPCCKFLYSLQENHPNNKYLVALCETSL